MTRTTAPRVRQTNLYTVESDGQPVAQAMAISQAEAVRLYVESVQQPTMSARLSSPLEARTLAGLPLLQREPAAVDTRTADLFEATPAADHVEDILTMVEPLAAGGFAPCGRALGDCGKATHTCGRDGCGAEVVEMPPQPAMHLPRFFALGDEEPAAEQPGEAVAGDCAEPASPPADAPHASADAPTLSERMAGVELGKQGEHRWGAAFLDADANLTEGLTSGKQIDELAAELRRGFDFGRASVAEKTPQPEPKHQAEAAADRRAFGGKPVARYRNPADGASWSGRGLKPRWMAQALEDGRTMDEFLI